MKKRIVFIIIFLALVLISYNTAQAQGLVPPASGDGCANSANASECGNYELNDMVQLVANVSGLILTLVGSLALLMFIYGGILMITSGGGGGLGADGKSQVNQGKKVITAAIVGIIIVFCSWLIIKFVLGTLGVEWNGEIKKITVNTEQLYNI